MLYNFSVEEPEPVETSIGRAGKRVFDLLILLALIAGGIVLGRAIQWKQLLTGVKPAAAVSPSPKQAQKSAARPASRNSKGKTENLSQAASGEDKNEKTQESAPAEETRQTPKPDPAKKKDGQ